ncbi:uncharacterized protein LOC133134685 [Conger conger]|uniref:uncharacterized protein LOC133134685 n=1 Tax=Conger conger TaxID=82655 RepID=UPI002A5A0E75|nr:uncharacterized protein LOC133134685 [Conger conger]XP_061106951.1 uncharacterized protein LOC133134685 [Conger conger]
MAPGWNKLRRQEEGSSAFIRKKYNQWSEERMRAAMCVYRETTEAGQKPNLRFLARAWNVPKSTLEKRVKGLVSGHTHSSGRKPFLPANAEKELAELLKTLATRGFRLTKQDVQNIAFDFAKANNIKGFSEVKKQAGYYWLRNFNKRNPGVGIRESDVAAAAARAPGKNPQVVHSWFEEYKTLLNELGLEDIPSHLWSCEESGLQDDFTPRQVVSTAGKPCHDVTAGHRGETTTVLAAFNAVGTFGPTMVIFKGKRLRNEWLLDSPVNVLAKVSENGWINSNLFLEWGEMFIRQLPKDDPNPHILLLDGHSSHVYNLEFLKLMRRNNVHVMCYPAHSTHALRPADKPLFTSLKYNWQEEGRKWNLNAAGQKLPVAEFFTLFNEAWKKTATIENGQAVFKTTGMFPLNEAIITAVGFAPSLTTERSLPAEASMANPTIAPESHTTEVLENMVGEVVLTKEEALEEGSKFVLFTPTSSTSPGPSTSAGISLCCVQNDPPPFPSTSSSVAPESRPVTFSDTIQIQKQEQQGNKRAKPATFRLTDQQHFEYLGSKTKKPGKYLCKRYKQLHGDSTDPKANEDWVSFHESCGEEDGIFEDESFICEDCQCRV